MTKILHVLQHKKCSAGHHIPKTAISECEGIEGEQQAHLQSWKNSHEETGPTGPSNSLLSQGRQYKEMLHCVTWTPQMRHKLQTTGAYKKERAQVCQMQTQKRRLDKSNHGHTRLDFTITETKRHTVQKRFTKAECRLRWKTGGEIPKKRKRNGIKSLWLAQKSKWNCLRGFKSHSIFSKRNQATDDPSSREGNLYDSRYNLPSSPYDNYMCWINTRGDTF